MPELRYCADAVEDIRAAGGEPEPCCWSCHEDEESGYSDLIEHEDYYVCCAVSRSLHEAGL